VTLWIKFKRILLILIGVLVVLLGAGAAVSALLGYYGDHLGVILGGVVGGILLVALGGFLVRTGIRGSDRDVSDVDLI